MPAVIDRFAWVARYYLDLLPPATCIEQTRIVMECLTMRAAPGRVHSGDI